MANGMAADNAGTNGDSAMSYENTDIQEITRRQLNQDIMAYRYDLDLCRSLFATDVTPQEARALQLRTLDIGHQIRSAQHRIELIEAQQRQSQMPAMATYHNGVHSTHRGAASRPADSPPNGSAVKRQRLTVKRSHSTEDVANGNGTPQQLATAADAKSDSFTPVNGFHAHPTTNETSHGSSAVQRLGFWKCRLCVASKYLNAGPNRVPSEPSKWPLKDVSKMLNHFLDLHTEHTPAERCMELGAALAQNRGPFEYWLTQTRKQELDDLSVIDGYVNTLQAGNLPEGLRRLNRAAGLFPNSTHEKKAV
ncbi:uncharacterized protein B0I36DRAFT_325227 [Microdochium trichocladiopsis]|uniref:Uncharacterized protein n=1 Tax=Microdochium trichocladiopsis TaxID=1682393 RepID=A0A9P8Y4G0_9PEZI|nr:uncharacterized protein B0I36DRAFT_325227 [Microdochium trichocladiopsis]KAH7029194.1 hypothetical protein B0I36DRAFT_325227 [Microdochium trichocladiopsis]